MLKLFFGRHGLPATNAAHVRQYRELQATLLQQFNGIEAFLRAEHTTMPDHLCRTDFVLEAGSFGADVPIAPVAFVYAVGLGASGSAPANRYVMAGNHCQYTAGRFGGGNSGRPPNLAPSVASIIPAVVVSAILAIYGLVVLTIRRRTNISRAVSPV